MLPSKLFPLLAVPGTDEPLFLKTTEIGDGDEPYAGWLEGSNGIVWARLNGFKFNFLRFSPVTNDERMKAALGASLASVPVSVPCNLEDSSFRFSGSWFRLNEFLVGCDAVSIDAFLEFETDVPAVDLKFHAHEWSGVACVFVNGVLFREIDLFHESVSVVQTVRVHNDEGCRIRIRLAPSGRANTKARGRQMILEGVSFVDLKSRVVPRFTVPHRVNKGGEFNQRLFEMMEILGEELGCQPVIVDVGGGKRHLGVENYINLEYSAYEEPSVFGDALHLPFRSNSIDCIYSAAVFEHVRDPLKMGEEIYRVLKKGGRALLNSAFMQPVHSEGQHFFNLTPYGIELVVQKFSERKISWDGSLSDMFSWILDVSGVSSSVDPNDRNLFSEVVSRFDRFVTYDRLMYIASGVWAEVRKG